MDQRVSDQLEKVLAMADSSHDGEAAAAVRKARQLLSRDGLSFGDLARAASLPNRSRMSLPFSLFSGQQVHLETQIAQLRQKLDDAQNELNTQTIQAEYWRRRATDMEQNLNLRQSEADRWRQLARDTVEKLWDLGQSIKVDEFTSSVPAGEAMAPLKVAAK